MKIGSHLIEGTGQLQRKMNMFICEYTSLLKDLPHLFVSFCFFVLNCFCLFNVNEELKSMN